MPPVKNVGDPSSCAYVLVCVLIILPLVPSDRAPVVD